jgi:hypothetical protein
MSEIITIGMKGCGHYVNTSVQLRSAHEQAQYSYLSCSVGFKVPFSSISVVETKSSSKTWTEPTRNVSRYRTHYTST